MQSLVYGNSLVFRKLVERTDQYASAQWPVLILGETGVGKELLAKRLHEKSAVRQGNFVPINCGAIPGSLFESEFFGYERGAFSGAVQSYRGLLRSAHGGTVFLDEVGELDASAQIKLLRWLDNGEVRSLGSTRLDRVQARLVAATNVDLVSAVSQGNFRLDLLERLGVLTLNVPALRERPEDVLPISEALLQDVGARYEREDLALLEGFSWPGNVRQLRNVLVRSIARGEGTVRRETLVRLLEEEKYLAQALGKGINRDILDTPLAELEKRVILDRIRRCQGNKKRAAKELGIAKSTLHEKIRRWEREETADRPFVGRGFMGG